MGRILGAVAIAALLVGIASRAYAKPSRSNGGARKQHAASLRNERAEARGGVRDGDRYPRPISLGLVLGYGVSLEDAPANPWGVGFGARGGYNLGPVFLGARFVFYAGEDPSNIWEVGLDLGFDFRAGIFTARPGVGLGIANVTIELGPQNMESETEVYVAPGATALLDVAEDVFVGAEGRAQLIFAEPGREALIVLGTAGLRF